MPNSTSKKPVNISKEIIDKFDYVYPKLKQVFIERAITLALQDKKYFEEVFFNPLFVEVK